MYIPKIDLKRLQNPNTTQEEREKLKLGLHFQALSLLGENKDYEGFFRLWKEIFLDANKERENKCQV